jgi:hypothetical protein
MPAPPPEPIEPPAPPKPVSPAAPPLELPPVGKLPPLETLPPEPGFPPLAAAPAPPEPDDALSSPPPHAIATIEAQPKEEPRTNRANRDMDTSTSVAYRKRRAKLVRPNFGQNCRLGGALA